MGASMELAARRKDGTEFPAEISLSAIATDQGILVAAAIRDVSERRRAAEAQNRLASIVQSSYDAIMGMTSDGMITSWNPGATRLFGYSEDEILGRNRNVLIPAEEREREHGILARVADGEKVEEYVTKRLRKDGSPVTVSLMMSPIADVRGRICGVATVSRDVTERLRAEARFRSLLEAAPDAMVGVRADGVIAFANSQAEKLFGYPRDELVGQPVELLVPGHVRSIHPSHRGRYLEDPRPRPMGASMELAARRKDGSEFPAEISLSVLETDEGPLVSAAIRDATERRRATEAQNRLASIVQSSHDAIVGKTVDGVVTSWNPGAARLYGFTAEEAIGRHARMLFPPEQRADEEAILARTAGGERIEQYVT
jgi:two-component system cell cycle sensor histidine kinase/response regulator CckA